MAKSRRNDVIPEIPSIRGIDPEIIAPIQPATPQPRRKQPPINIVRCEICGKPARAYSSKNTVTYYKCDGKIEPPGCGHTFTKYRQNTSRK